VVYVGSWLIHYLDRAKVVQGSGCRLVNQEKEARFLAEPKMPFFATETIDMLQLEHIFVWYLNLNTPENSSKVP